MTATQAPEALTDEKIAETLAICEAVHESGYEVCSLSSGLTVAILRELLSLRTTGEAVAVIAMEEVAFATYRRAIHFLPGIETLPTGTKLFAHPPAPQPEVKALEWTGEGARSPLGDLYQVDQLSEIVWMVSKNGTPFPGWKATQAEGRAMCQADFEGLVRSALVGGAA